MYVCMNTVSYISWNFYEWASGDGEPFRMVRSFDETI